MKIQVTLEFNSPEEAIVALGKYVKDAPAPVKSSSSETPRAVKAPAAAGTPKRGPGRPKKAKPEGDAVVGLGAVATPVARDKVDTSPSGAAPDRPAVAFVQVEPVPPQPASITTSTATPTAQDVTAALQACLNAVGMTKTRACFARHGVTRGGEVKDADRAAFIEYVNKVAAGELDPEAGN